MAQDRFFLSAENPVANIDQRDLENLALRLLEHPQVKQARRAAEHLFRNAMADPLRDQMERFDQMVDEYVFYWALRAANSDAQRPKVLRIMEPPIHRFGRDAPGSRWGGENPNLIYRMIPIAHGVAYEIYGRVTCADPPASTYSIVAGGAAPTIQGVLDSRDIPVAEDGGFVITLDAQPANGRPAHLRIRPGDDHLLIGDALGDWLTQTPNALRVERSGSCGEAAPTLEGLAEQASHSLLEGLYFTYYRTQSGSARAANDVRAPQSSAAFGGRAAQAEARGNLQLADDEALIVRMNSAGALFRDIQLFDRFFLSLNYWDRTGNLNMTQMAVDDDGLFTVVVAHEDPGVHNWLDTGGLNRTILGSLWRTPPRDGSGEPPFLSTHTVKFRRLDRELPSGVRRIDSLGRAEQIARRKAGFDKRLLDR